MVGSIQHSLIKDSRHLCDGLTWFFMKQSVCVGAGCTFPFCQQNFCCNHCCFHGSNSLYQTGIIMEGDIQRQQNFLRVNFPKSNTFHRVIRWLKQGIRHITVKFRFCFHIHSRIRIAPDSFLVPPPQHSMESTVRIPLYHQALSFHAGFSQNGAYCTGELPADHPFPFHRSIEACVDITFIKCGIIQFMHCLDHLCEPGTSINRSICLGMILFLQSFCLSAVFSHWTIHFTFRAAGPMTWLIPGTSSSVIRYWRT